MKNSKPVSTPLVGHFKLSKRLYPSTEKEKGKISVIPYSSTDGSLIYAMVCTIPNVSHAVGVVNRFLANQYISHTGGLSNGSLDISEAPQRYV